MSFPTVFLAGAPRSGTTWLQSMLGARPEIAAPQEIRLFSRYVRAWRDAWLRQAELLDDERGLRVEGLPSLFTEAEFDGILRDVIDRVEVKVMGLKPSASVLLLKDPYDTREVDLIHRYLPEAKVLHLVRDGRDVAASMTAASKGWGRRWAPDTVDKAAQTWRTYVSAARRAEQLTDRFLEVHYEDLLEQGPAVLERVLRFCGVEANREECVAIYQQFAFENMAKQKSETSTLLWGGESERRLGRSVKEPEGFFRVGKAGSWEAWGPFERWSFDRVAGDLLVELGYEKDDGWVDAGFNAKTAYRLRVGGRKALTWSKEAAVRAGKSLLGP